MLTDDVTTETGNRFHLLVIPKTEWKRQLALWYNGNHSFLLHGQGRANT